MLRLVLDGERTATALGDAAGLSSPAASRHLKVLLDAGLVSVRSVKTMRLYSLDPARIRQVRAVLSDFWDDRLESLKTTAEALYSELAQRETA
jgi:DNA-binding transcriptional ArsR family regulator